MQKLSFFSLSLLLLLVSCNESNPKERVLTGADSFKIANAEYVGILKDLSKADNIQEILGQGWELSDDLESIEGNNDAMGSMPFRSFYLSADSSFVVNPRNSIDFGKWSYNDATKIIQLNQQREGKLEYKIASVKRDELIVLNQTAQSKTKLKFVSGGKRHKVTTADPYHVSNNQWRIAPKKAETPAEVRQRLKDCLHFYVLFYRDFLAREQKAISFYGFPTCLKWYAGGIFMVKEKDLQPNWFGCFYNKEQSMQAYKMMEGIIGKKYNWPKEKMSWVKKNLLVLEQMHANL